LSIIPLTFPDLNFDATQQDRFAYTFKSNPLFQASQGHRLAVPPNHETRRLREELTIESEKFSSMFRRIGIGSRKTWKCSEAALSECRSTSERRREEERELELRSRINDLTWVTRVKKTKELMLMATVPHQWDQNSEWVPGQFMWLKGRVTVGLGGTEYSIKENEATQQKQGDLG
jgi:hypothetical protein